VLHFFFDGVPPPESVLAALDRDIRAADDTPIAGDKPRLRPRPKLKNLHEPFADDACDDCHDGRSSNQLIAKGADLCGSCHDLDDFAGIVMHGPMAAGACTQCHDPHKSDYASLLRFEAAVLCGTCHDSTTFDEGEQHRAERGEDCVRCHNPHATDREYMLEPDVDLS
jgi:predicted CXXCH cytochrome family protein